MEATDRLSERDDDPWVRAWDAELAGRREEALRIMTSAAQAGSIDAAKSLGLWLTEKGSDRREEGRSWLERAVEAGDDQAAWNLAMDYRLEGDQEVYLIWLRRAQGLGHEEARTIVSHIDRLAADGLPWPMYIYGEVDRDTVWQMIDSYRGGEMSATDLNSWAIGVHERRSAMRLSAPAAPLARIIAELAADEIGLDRAAELIFRLQTEIPDAD